MAEEELEKTDPKREELFPFQEHFLNAYWERFTRNLFPENEEAEDHDFDEVLADEHEGIEEERAEAPVMEESLAAEPEDQEEPTVAQVAPEPAGVEETIPEEMQAPISKTTKPPRKAQPTKKGSAREAEELRAKRDLFTNNFYDFQDVVLGCYEWLVGSSAEQPPSLWAQLTSLGAPELNHVTDTEDVELRRLLVKTNEELVDDEGWDEGRKIFEKNRLELTELRQAVMVHAVDLALERVGGFKTQRYVDLPSKDKIEIVIPPEKTPTAIGFKVKFRRGEIGKLDELILDMLQIRRMYRKVTKEQIHMVLVVFTTEADSQLGAYDELFEAQVHEIEPRAIRDIRFVAINVMSQFALEPKLGAALQYLHDANQGTGDGFKS